MVRTHTLVEYRFKEFELEQALRSLKKQQEGLDYKLDVEFYHKLENLTERHGYSLTQVFDLLMSRYEGSAEQVGGGPVGVNARTNAALLEMIQRLEPTHPPTPGDIDNRPAKSLSAGSSKSDSNDSNSELASSSDLDMVKERRLSASSTRSAVHDPNLTGDFDSH